MKTTVINDLHEEVNRTGGTTPESLSALLDYSRRQHGGLLAAAAARGAKRVIVNGDLTDQYSVALGGALYLYETADHFLTQHPDKELVWALGNHDLSKDSSKLGTVAFIGALLARQYPTRFTLVSKPTLIDNIYIIPHLPNQDLFDMALDQIPDGVDYCLLHCNFDNVFAGQSDHSLNLPRAKAKELVKRMTLVLGHEHQHRTLMNDKVIIVGNQFPTSVSDCLAHGDAQKDGRKYCLDIEGEDMELIQTWSRNDDVGGYAEVDWREPKPGNADFIRVVGKATAAESADVIKAISKLRQSLQAFVITNAVKIDAVEGMDDLAESVEDIRSVNVIEMLLEQLDPDQQAVVRALRAEAV